MTPEVFNISLIISTEKIENLNYDKYFFFIKDIVDSIFIPKIGDFKERMCKYGLHSIYLEKDYSKRSSSNQ